MDEIWLKFILGVGALIVIWLVSKLALKKNTKDFKIGYGIFKGFEFSCSFYEESDTKNC